MQINIFMLLLSLMTVNISVLTKVSNISNTKTFCQIKILSCNIVAELHNFFHLCPIGSKLVLGPSIEYTGIEIQSNKDFIKNPSSLKKIINPTEPHKSPALSWFCGIYFIISLFLILLTVNKTKNGTKRRSYFI